MFPADPNNLPLPQFPETSVPVMPAVAVPAQPAHKKYIFIAMAAILLLVLGLAGWKYLPKLTAKPLPAVTKTNNITPIPKLKLPVILSLRSPITSAKVGDKLNVSLDLSSDTMTDGIDVIINYDPKLVEASLKLGTLFDDYPVNTVDNKTGKILLSGISMKLGGILANGNIGTIIFTARAPGQVKIDFDFTLGSTTDSNVIDAKQRKDALTKVDNLLINIQK